VRKAEHGGGLARLQIKSQVCSILFVARFANPIRVLTWPLRRKPKPVNSGAMEEPQINSGTRLRDVGSPPLAEA